MAAMAEASEGPLWNQLKSQLYKPEVKMIKRLVGHELIQQNRLMWDEISSLRQMLAEFRDQNDELCKGRRQHADLCDTQHRELLKRQAHLLLNDLRAKASGCGHALEDMVPEFRGSEIYRYLIKEDSGAPPATPSTRPSTASTRSCNTPERPGMPPCNQDLLQNLASLPNLPMGKALGLDDLDDVALSIREALSAEHQWLLATIEEEYQLLSHEEQRRTVVRGAPCASTAELKQFLLRLQDIASSPSLRTLSLTESRARSERSEHSEPPMGGANIRRLQALISMRRNGTRDLHTVEENGGFSAASFGGPTVMGPNNEEFDPFFGDPI